MTSHVGFLRGFCMFLPIYIYIFIYQIYSSLFLMHIRALRVEVRTLVLVPHVIQPGNSSNSMKRTLLQSSATSLDTLNPMVSSFKPYLCVPYFPRFSSLKWPFPSQGSEPPRHVVIAVARLCASIVTRRSAMRQGAKSLESASRAKGVSESLGN